MYESPIPARILAVDPGARSGWAWFEPPSAARKKWEVRTGSTDVWSQGPDFIASFGAQDAVLVIEAPGINSRGAFLRMVLALGGAIGIWKRSWRLAHGSKELDVVQVSWRAGLLGGSSAARTSKEWKAASIEYVQGMRDWHESPIDLKIDDGSDLDGEMADAVGLGWWALHSPALADALGARSLAALGWDDRAACLAAKKIRTNDRSAR